MTELGEIFYLALICFLAYGSYKGFKEQEYGAALFCSVMLGWFCWLGWHLDLQPIALIKVIIKTNINL
ncbi:MAG: hypothetical protein RI842_11225 [Schleiferiaceae bacterium]|nr:hypothetical protein [Schleiferiaceae bacterium]